MERKYQCELGIMALGILALGIMALGIMALGKLSCSRLNTTIVMYKNEYTGTNFKNGGECSYKE